MPLPEISVIMLTYNREKMVGRAIKSILQQTYESFELILVDNGSTDQSGIICDQYAGQDKRILVIHNKKENIGCGRNLGLKNASGNFIIFIDDDDYAYPNMLEFLHNLAVRHEADIAVCGSHKLENGQMLPNIKYEDLYIMDAGQATEAYLHRKLYNAAMPTKLVSHSLFEKIPFSSEGNYDDITTAYRYFVHAGRVAAQGIPQYCFCRHPGNNSSAATKFHLLNPMQLNEYLQAFRERSVYISRYFPHLEPLARYSEWSYMLSMCEKIDRFKLENCSSVYQKMKTELMKNWQEYYNGIYIEDFEKIWLEKYMADRE